MDDGGFVRKRETGLGLERGGAESGKWKGGTRKKMHSLFERKTKLSCFLTILLGNETKKEIFFGTRSDFFSANESLQIPVKNKI